MRASHGTLDIELDGNGLRVPVSAWSLEGFRKWVTSKDFPEGVRATWVGGEVFLQMSPEGVDTHAAVKLAIAATLLQIAKARALGEVYPDGVLLTNRRGGVSTEPDAAFASFATLKSRRLKRVRRKRNPDHAVELEGTPDIVIEVVSPSSVRKDTVRLRDAYASARVPEYWIVDARLPVLRFDILSLVGRTYRSLSETGQPRRSKVLGLVFRLRRSRNAVGNWQYDLDASELALLAPEEG